MLKRLKPEKSGNILNIFRKIRLAPLCLFAFILKSLVISPSYAESLVILGLSALYGFYYLIEAKRIPKPTEQMLQEIHNIKNQVASIKMGMGVRSQTNDETKKKRRF